MASIHLPDRQLRMDIYVDFVCSSRVANHFLMVTIIQVYDAKGKHSTFEHAQMGVMLARKFGDDIRKWTLGIPFYGRNVKVCSL